MVALISFVHVNKMNSQINQYKKEKSKLKTVLESPIKSCSRIKVKLSQKNMELPRKYEGFMHAECISLRKYNEIWDDLLKLLIKENVKLSMQKKYYLNCIKEDIKFEIEVMTIEDGSEFAYVRINKIIGSFDLYNKIVTSLLSHLNL